jgi:murein DD-endopeptidase MepM/ murein hydrolase activator NlpD
LKRVFQKKPSIAAPLQVLPVEQSGTSGVFRQQVNAPVTMLSIALSLGASASLVSVPGLALAAEGSAIVVLPKADHAAEASSTLRVPASNNSGTAYHTVSEGDSLWQIAAEHQADVGILKVANGISQNDVLRVGQVLRVPAESSLPRFAFDSEVMVGGVGGDVPPLSAGSTAVAVLSVDELENSWKTLDEAALDEAALDEAALAELEAQDLNELVEDEATPTNAALPQLSSALPLTEVPVSDPEPEVVVKPDSTWQDASVQLASANPSNSFAAPASEVEPSTQASLPLPDSIPLHGQPQSARSQVVAPNRPSPSLASVVSEVATPELSEATPELSETATPSASDASALAIQPRVTQANSVRESSAPTIVSNSTPISREQVIQDHLARIRESNGALVDREVLNARIREARQELERSRNELATAPTPRLTASRANTAEPVAINPAPQTLASASTSTASPVLPKVDGSPSQTWSVTDVADTTAMASTPAPSSATAVSSSPRLAALPQSLATPQDTATTEAVSLPTGGEQLLAAAPLGAEAYRPFPDVPTGQMVTPNMPMLPGAGEFLPEAPQRSNGFVWPTTGTFTSGYGPRWGRMHRGIDIAGPVGTPIVAAASGVVVRSGWNSGGYGNLVDIRHADGSLTRYAHNSRLLVREGQQVNQGQQIAAMGSTGFSTGPHLHFEIHLPGTGTVNPMAHLPGR